MALSEEKNNSENGSKNHLTRDDLNNLVQEFIGESETLFEQCFQNVHDFILKLEKSELPADAMQQFQVVHMLNDGNGMITIGNAAYAMHACLLFKDENNDQYILDFHLNIILGLKEERFFIVPAADYLRLFGGGSSTNCWPALTLLHARYKDNRFPSKNQYVFSLPTVDVYKKAVEDFKFPMYLDETKEGFNFHNLYEFNRYVTTGEFPAISRGNARGEERLNLERIKFLLNNFFVLPEALVSRLEANTQEANFSSTYTEEDYLRISGEKLEGNGFSNDISRPSGEFGRITNINDIDIVESTRSHKAQEEAATKMQSLFRGYQVRNRLSRNEEKGNDNENGSKNHLTRDDLNNLVQEFTNESEIVFGQCYQTVYDFILKLEKSELSADAMQQFQIIHMINDGNGMITIGNASYAMHACLLFKDENNDQYILDFYLNSILGLKEERFFIVPAADYLRLFGGGSSTNCWPALTLLHARYKDNRFPSQNQYVFSLPTVDVYKKAVDNFSFPMSIYDASEKFKFYNLYEFNRYITTGEFPAISRGNPRGEERLTLERIKSLLNNFFISPKALVSRLEANTQEANFSSTYTEKDYLRINDEKLEEYGFSNDTSGPNGEYHGLTNIGDIDIAESTRSHGKAPKQSEDTSYSNFRAY